MKQLFYRSRKTNNQSLTRFAFWNVPDESFFPPYPEDSEDKKKKKIDFQGFYQDFDSFGNDPDEMREQVHKQILEKRYNDVKQQMIENEPKVKMMEDIFLKSVALLRLDTAEARRIAMCEDPAGQYAEVIATGIRQIGAGIFLEKQEAKK